MQLSGIIVLLISLELLFQILFHPVRASSTTLTTSACVVFASQEEVITEFVSDKVMAVTKGKLFALVLLAKLFSAFSGVALRAPRVFSERNSASHSLGLTGSVGIGTTGPNNLLDVDGTIRVTQAGTPANYFTIADVSGAAWFDLSNVAGGGTQAVTFALNGNNPTFTIRNNMGGELAPENWTGS